MDKKDDSGESGSGSNENSPSKPARGPVYTPAGNSGLTYKYYSDLSADEMQKYSRPNIGQDQRFVQGRGNVLGVSTPNLNQWVGQILKQGEVVPDTTDHDNQLGCIVKLYDKNINAFKLNE